MITTALVLGLVALSGVLGIDETTTANPTGPTTAKPTGSRVTNQATIWLAKKENTTAENRYLCSGAIVARNYVLTHPECIMYYEMEDILLALGRADYTTTEKFVKAKNFTFHEEGNIALIQADMDFFTSNNMIPLKETPAGSKDKCFVSGWLQDSVVWEEYEVDYVAEDACASSYAPSNITVVEGGVCASRTDGNNCGVIGMPLICDGKLTGVFSLTNWECKLPAQFSGIEHWKKWIEDQTKPPSRGGGGGGAAQMAPLVSVIAGLLLAYRAVA